MANKKYTPPPKKNIPSQKGPVAVKKKEMKIPTSNKRLHYITALIIAGLAMLLYANTFHHDFVLDDFSVISENRITTGGTDSVVSIFKSGYREGNFTVEDNLYRPFTKAMFAVEYAASGGQPGPLHVINVLLYGLLCGFIFLSLLKFFPGQYYLALITAVLFTFHPLHTEVVANIKSRDEIMALFFLIASLRFAKLYVDTNKFMFVGLTGLFYFLGLLTKESAITYMALLPISLYFMTKLSWSKIGIVTVSMLVITLLYLFIHKTVIGGIGLPQETIPLADNSINVKGTSQLQKSMTAIFILGLYLKLMIFPHPLSCDYSFDTIPFVKDFGHAGFLLALVIHLGLLGYAIWGFKKKSIASYAIFLYFITISIVSNVFPQTLIGTNMAERLVFMPSLGFCLLIAFLMVKLLKAEKLAPSNFSEIFSRKAAVWLILLPLMVVASVKTVTRNKDWKNVSTLFNADIKTVPNSVHMLLYHAGMITNTDSLAIKTPEKRLETLKFAEKELLQTIKLLEEFPNAHSLLGRVYKEIGQYYVEKQEGTLALEYYNKAIFEYKKTLSFNDKDPTTFNNYATCYFSIGRYDSAEVYFKKAIQITPICYADGLANLGSVYGTYGNIARNTANAELLKGNVELGQQKMAEANNFFNMAIDMFNQTLLCDKENIPANQFLAMTYINLGDTVKARPYTDRYNQLMQEKQNRLNKMK